MLRLARPGDAEALRDLIRMSTETLLAAFLPPEQVAASRAFMSLDTQLIADGTYFIVELEGAPVGCGGWGKRATTHGGDESGGRDARLLDPAHEPARIRAMYTHPHFSRRSIGRSILEASENAARASGFTRAMLNATLGGEPLYRACGYAETRRFLEAGVPMIQMEKDLP